MLLTNVDLGTCGAFVGVYERLIVDLFQGAGGREIVVLSPSSGIDNEYSP